MESERVIPKFRKGLSNVILELIIKTYLNKLIQRPLGFFVLLQGRQPSLSVLLRRDGDKRQTVRPASSLGVWAVEKADGRDEAEDENGRRQQWWDSAERPPPSVRQALQATLLRGPTCGRQGSTAETHPGLRLIL